TAAADAEGQTPISLSLVSFAGASLAERRITLIFGRAGGAVAGTDDRPEQKEAKPAPALDPAPPVAHEPSGNTTYANAEQAREPREFSVDETEQMLLLMKRGAENMAKGRVNIAQMFYRRAAESGWAPGALALARSYDPKTLTEVVVV